MEFLYDIYLMSKMLWFQRAERIVKVLIELILKIFWTG